MPEEKHKNRERRFQRKYLWIIVAILIFSTAFISGFHFGYEANNNGLQSLTQTQSVQETKNPINKLDLTQDVVNTEISKLLNTVTAIADIQGTLEPNGSSNE